jgi:hypothetical protein
LDLLGKSGPEIHGFFGPDDDDLSDLPSGKHTKNHGKFGKSRFSIGKSVKKQILTTPSCQD